MLDVVTTHDKWFREVTIINDCTLDWWDQVREMNHLKREMSVTIRAGTAYHWSRMAADLVWIFLHCVHLCLLLGYRTLLRMETYYVKQRRTKK